MNKTQLLNITSSSPFITAKQTDSDSNWITIDVTMIPGLPAGAIMESIVAHSNNDSFPEAKLKVSGSILGDVSISPEALMLYVAERGKADKSTTRSLIITNHLPDKPLTSIAAYDPDDRLILEIAAYDPDDRLILEMETIEEGLKFKLTATVKNEFLNTTTTLAGKIIVTTDNPTARELSAIYRIIVRNR
jgi:hypothetical protein